MVQKFILECMKPMRGHIIWTLSYGYILVSHLTHKTNYLFPKNYCNSDKFNILGIMAISCATLVILSNIILLSGNVTGHWQKQVTTHPAMIFLSNAKRNQKIRK